MKSDLCPICLEHPQAKGAYMCGPCAKSYERTRDRGDVTVKGAIIWAANRARMAERRAFVRLTIENIRKEAQEKVSKG